MKRFFAVSLAICLFSVLTGCELFETKPAESGYSKIIADFESSVGTVPLYYSRLTDTEKAAYISIVNTINSSLDVAQVPNIDTQSLHAVTSAVSYDNPQFLWLSKSWTVTQYASNSMIEIPYLVSAEERTNMSNELEAKVAQILSGVNDAMGDYEKELYFHNYLVANCQYDRYALSDEEFNDAYTAYGALVEGRAVCEGYARSMQLLLSRVGINSFLITGTALNQSGTRVNHMWNVVNIDSEWYHLDATWNDPQSTNSFNTVWHTYFNLTDEEILRDHSFDTETDCTSIRANYHRKNSIHFTSFNSFDFTDALADEIYKAERKNLNFIEMRFSNQSDFESAKNALFKQQLIYAAVSRANNKYGVKINASSIFYSTVDTQFVIGIKF